MANILDELAAAFGAKDRAPNFNDSANATRGERNHNQGNIEDGPYARSQPGYAGSDGRFAKFNTPDAGADAQLKLIRDGKGYRGKPISGIIQRYAPPATNGGDNSIASVRNYIGYVAARAGVDPDGVIPPEKYASVAQAMREFETGKRAKGAKFTPYAGAIAGAGMSQNGAGGAYNASGPGVGVADPAQYLKGLESALGPEVKGSQNVKTNASAIFGSDAELQKRSAAVEGALVEQGGAINVLNQTMEAAQAAAREAMTRQVQQTRDVSNEITAGTEELKAKVMPVFRARGRIADQLDKLNTMSGLEKGLRGIFDSNYDEEHLTRQLDKFDRTLAAREADFEYLNKLHGVGLAEIGRRYQTDTAIPALLQEQAKEDLGLVGMKLAQTNDMLGNLKSTISTESSLIAAKAGARADLLGRLDSPTVLELMTKAEQSGGIVAFNGVEFSAKELREKIQLDEQQMLGVESAKMAIASGRMDMAEKYAVNLAKSLTRSQLQGAIANGGVHNGVQLPQDLLTNLYQGAISRDETRAAAIARTMPANVAYQTAHTSLTNMLGLQNRSKSLFGAQTMMDAAPYTTRASSLARALVAAVQRGEPPETVLALTQQMNENSANYEKYVEGKLLNQAGGDKVAAGYLRGFVYGQPMSEGSSVEALTYFAMKGNLPVGLSLSREAKQVFGKAKELVQAQYNAPNGQKLSKQAIQAKVSSELGDYARTVLGKARHDQLYESLPDVAAQSGHPFGKMSLQTWNEIRSQAVHTGAESVAGAINTTADNVLTMQRTGKALSSSEEDRQLFDALKKNQAQANGVEFSTMLKLVDLQPQIQKGVDNSSLMMEFMGSGKMVSAIGDYAQGRAGKSMADYLINPLASTGVESQFQRTLTGFQDSAATERATKLQMINDPASHLLYRPRNRTGIILTAIPGVGTTGAKALAPFVDQVFDSFRPSRMSITPNAKMVEEDEALHTALQNTKFENPAQETYRKLVLKNWAEYSTQHQGFIERLWDGLTWDYRAANSGRNSE